MSAKRNCPTIKLSKQPLALVLIQVRFSPISNIAKYIPDIQDGLRRLRFPLLSEQKAFTFNITPDGVNRIDNLQWRFGKADDRAAVILDAEQVLLQTTEYDVFEKFFEEFRYIFEIVMKATDHATYGVIQRLGLRYIDQVRPQGPEDSIDLYLREELRGMSSSYFIDDERRYTISVAGTTQILSKIPGTLAIRVIRGEKGFDLPPDVIAGAPKRARPLAENEKVALIDMDHSLEVPMGPGFDIDYLETVFYALHDTIIKAFHESVVTPEGIKKWQ